MSEETETTALPTHWPPPVPLDRIAADDVREHGTDEQLAALYCAMAKAKAEFRPVPKNHDGQVGHQKFRYAPLATLQDCTVGALSKHGLAVVQPFAITGGLACIRTIVSHEGGARLVSRFCFEPAADIKQLGSQSTYYRRYAYQSVLCVDSGDDADNDGQSMPSGAKWPAKQNPAPPRQPSASELARPEKPKPKPQATRQAPAKEPPKEKPAEPRQSTADIQAELDKRTAAAKAKVTQQPDPEPEAAPEHGTEDYHEAEDAGGTEGPDEDLPIQSDTGITLNKFFRANKFTGPQVTELCKKVTGRDPGDLDQPGGEALAHKLLDAAKAQVAARG